MLHAGLKVAHRVISFDCTGVVVEVDFVKVYEYALFVRAINQNANFSG